MTKPPIVGVLERVRDLLKNHARGVAEHLQKVHEDEQAHAELRRKHEEAQEQIRQLHARLGIGEP